MTEIRLSYLVCATPRTGSNFLCEVLSSAGMAGHPEEYFWQRPFWYGRWGISDFATFLHHVREEGTTPNGVFGSKLMWEQVKELVRELASLHGVPDDSQAHLLETAFPNLHYLWLRRTDRIRQGISYYRALETKRWRSTDLNRTSPDPPFNFEAIQSLIQLSEWEDEGWQDFFERHAITPFLITYEHLAESPEAAVREIIADLGLDQPGRLRSENWRHQKQADALTDEWAARYAGQQASSSSLCDEEVFRILGTWTA